MDWKQVSEFELEGSSWLAPKVCEMQVIGYSREKILLLRAHVGDWVLGHSPIVNSKHYLVMIGLSELSRYFR